MKINEPGKNAKVLKITEIGNWDAIFFWNAVILK
jgi:hypothetical protein